MTVRKFDRRPERKHVKKKYRQVNATARLSSLGVSSRDLGDAHGTPRPYGYGQYIGTHGIQRTPGPDRGRGAARCSGAVGLDPAGGTTHHAEADRRPGGPAVPPSPPSPPRCSVQGGSKMRLVM